MKKITRFKYLLLFLLAIFYFYSCEKPDSEKEFGFPLIYMPQAVMFSGGLNNDYPVPAGDNRFPNYIFDSIGGKLDIIMGVYRSGLQNLEDYSVEVYAKTDSANYIVNDSIVKNSNVLPTDVYSFPSTVSVTGGKRESTFYLTVDVAKLNSNYSSFSGQTLVLALAIRNPSKYELNKSLSTTILLIDTKKFMKKL